jgi:DNA-directed RNA polymerase subunit beta'
MGMGKSREERQSVIHAVRLGLASPEDVLAWSHGEVRQPTTFNARSGRPEPGGLFCESIFGPVQNWACRCGKYRGNRYEGVTCERCHVTVLHSRARRQRAGHINLAAPVVHPWFFRARPSPLALLLGLKPSLLEQVIYGQAQVVRNPGRSALEVGVVLDEADCQKEREAAGPDFATVTGAEGVLFLLQALDLEKLAGSLRAELAQMQQAGLDGTSAHTHLLRRLGVVEALRRSGNDRENFLLRRVLVLPPSLRPMVRLASGKYVTSELNDLYRRLVHRNNRLTRVLQFDAPERILLAEKRLLQQAVDALFDNRRTERPIQGRGQRVLRSLTDLLSGKSGRFRGNLLGKRVDYSARAVIVAGPELRLHQCGLPRLIALKLYEPFVVRELLRRGRARTIARARRLVEEVGRPGLVGRTARLIVSELGRARALEHAHAVLEGAVVSERDRERAVQNARDVIAEHGTPAARRQSARVLRELGEPRFIERAHALLRQEGPGATLRWVRRLLGARHAEVWDILEEVSRQHPVLLNRAPTLHRPGIQAFEPVLVAGNALRLHPLVCKAFNADFDGDQMAIHLPLSLPARVEASVLLLSAHNLFNPANGQPIVTPSQDIVLGCYYLTATLPDGDSLLTEKPKDTGDLPAPAPFVPPCTDSGSGRLFASPAEVLLANDLGRLGTHARIRVRLQPPGTGRSKQVVGEGQGEKPVELLPGALLETTVGRIVFNALLPAELPFYNCALTAGRLGRVISDCHRLAGQRATVEMVDRIKEAGFRAATRSGLSFAMDDLPAPRGKEAILAATRVKVEALQAAYRRGDLSEEEYALNLLTRWTAAQKEVGGQLLADLRHDRRGGRPYLNPLFVMADSGARGSVDQVRQLAGMRGLMASASGRLIERSITASLREGLPTWDYFLSAHGARKGLTDKGLRTADAGYLTRKLIDVAQHVVVTVPTCGTPRGIVRLAGEPGSAGKRSLASLVRGRVSRRTITGADGRVIVHENQMISAEQAVELEALGLREVEVRSPLTCEAERGVCQLCYGMDLANGRLAEQGLAVGILAAQSIGEPGTQLTLRTFHIGGVAGKDIVNDLERINRLLEAGRPEGAAVLAGVAGTVESVGVETVEDRRALRLRTVEGGEYVQWLPADRRVSVQPGERVEVGQAVTEGPVALADLLEVAGAEAVQERLLGEVQETCRHHGLEIDDRHLEVIVAQMLSKVRITEPGDTTWLPGQLVDHRALLAANTELKEWVRIVEAGESRFAVGERVPRAVCEAEETRLAAEGKQGPRWEEMRLARCRPHLRGITRAAREADSFLAAASFQRTAEVLAEAALAGRVDPLAGLKENVMLGHLVPAGTGLPRFRGSMVGLRANRARNI